MADSLLRRRRNGHRAEVTSVELFFDLVFVITITQISNALLAHLTWLGALEALMLLMIVWWAWIYTAWVTNWLDPQKLPVRLMLFVLMAVGLVFSSSLPEAFGERGLYFALAFVVFQLGRTLFMLWAVRGDESLRQNFTRIAVWIIGTGVLWIAGGLAEGELRLGLWLLALVLDYLSPALSFRVPGLGKSTTADWNVDGGHMAERAGLFVMIALGESVLATGVGFTELEWTTDVVLAMAVSLLQSIAFWWLYFGQHAEHASHVIETAEDPGRLARQAYTYAPILLIAGIVVSAVGDEMALSHPSGHMEMPTILVLVGGPALFLAGAVLFKLSVFGVWSISRLAGLAALLVAFASAGALTALQLSAATTLIVVLVALWETIDVARHPERYPVAARRHAE